jgi:uncharacterized membrane protein YeaQ/YmgE (transglycosylase-associated protein family)
MTLSARSLWLVIGVLGRLILPGRQHIGVFVTFVIGVGSALLGSVLARVVGTPYLWIIGVIRFGPGAAEGHLDRAHQFLNRPAHETSPEPPVRAHHPRTGGPSLIEAP